MTLIALDATAAAYPELTGTGVYSRRLLLALAALPPFRPPAEFRLVLCFRIGPYFRWARKRSWPAHSLVSPFWEPWIPPRSAVLFHGLNQRLPERSYPWRVVTVHDLFPLTSKTYSTPAFQRRFSGVIQHAVERADRMIAVSEATRNALLRHTRVPEDRIRVIHHGVDSAQPASASEQKAFREQVLQFGPEEKFFLNVGDIQPRKNVSNIVLALKRLPQYGLVLAGGDGFGAAEVHSLIEREGMRERVLRLGHASQETLRLLYSTATALVFPSLEEGFGLPILEAMSYGLPVVTSNCSSMPEVGGEAALYVPPGDVGAIRDAMERLAEDQALAADLARRGKERAKLFTWEKCARQTWEVYQEVLPKPAIS